MRRLLSMMWEPVNLAASLVTTLFRFWAGWPVRPVRERPALPLTLYEFEGCPFCRIARETVSALGLAVEMRPCPKAGERYRPEVVRLGGKAQFPYLIDPNTGTAMYESADIVRYLSQTYGGRGAPVTLALGPLNIIPSAWGLAFRGTAGVVNYGRTAPVEAPLVFRGLEGDPRARQVREMLCMLEIPYTWQPVWGAVRLEDPNTGRSVNGSFSARHYLIETYGQRAA